MLAKKRRRPRTTPFVLQSYSPLVQAHLSLVDCLIEMLDRPPAVAAEVALGHLQVMLCGLHRL